MGIRLGGCARDPDIGPKGGCLVLLLWRLSVLSRRCRRLENQQAGIDRGQNISRKHMSNVPEPMLCLHPQPILGHLI
jgi:hypothetical protein